jgi:hypothetical protein
MENLLFCFIFRKSRDKVSVPTETTLPDMSRGFPHSLNETEGTVLQTKPHTVQFTNYPIIDGIQSDLLTVPLNKSYIIGTFVEEVTSRKLIVGKLLKKSLIH